MVAILVHAAVASLVVMLTPVPVPFVYKAASGS